jgi:hypothetical protein
MLALSLIAYLTMSFVRIMQLSRVGKPVLSTVEGLPAVFQSAWARGAHPAWLD